MCLQLIRIGEHCRTMFASVRPLPRMHPKMPPQVRHLDELPIAHVAMVRSLPRVQPHVCLQMMVPGEPLVTLGALEGFLPRVGPFMVLEDMLIAEGAIADATCKLFIGGGGRGGGGVFGEVGAGTGWG